MRQLLAVLLVLACSACGADSSTMTPASPTPSPTPHAALPEPLETELAAIRADPLNSVGYGEKAFTPYEPNEAHALINARDPAITPRLLADIEATQDRVLKLALLHVLGKRADETVDQALLTAFKDPELTATAAYLLGRAGFKGYPKRPRGDLDAIRAALKRHIDDDTPFEDPFQRATFRTGDFALAAYIRLTGPSHYTFADPDTASVIGYTLPNFDAAQRKDLVAQAKR
jgi:hypothetical protein